MQLTRRRFLVLGFVGGAVALAVGLAPTWSREEALIDALSDGFFAVGEDAVEGPAAAAGFPLPSSLRAGAQAWAFVGRLPTAARWQARGAIRALDRAGLAAGGGRLSHLPVGRRQESPVGPLRLLTLAVRQLCALGTFTQPAMWAAIGYDGPTVRRSAQETP